MKPKLVMVMQYLFSLTYLFITYTHTFNGPLSRTTQVSQYKKGKTNLDFTEARDSEWQWHQLGHMQVCTLLQTDNYASTPPLSFLHARCPFCCPTDSVKALEVQDLFTKCPLMPACILDAHSIHAQKLMISLVTHLAEISYTSSEISTYLTGHYNYYKQ